VDVTIEADPKDIIKKNELLYLCVVMVRFVSCRFADFRFCEVYFESLRFFLLSTPMVGDAVNLASYGGPTTFTLTGGTNAGNRLARGDMSTHRSCHTYGHMVVASRS
jgi:hypothetical protein